MRPLPPRRRIPRATIVLRSPHDEVVLGRLVDLPVDLDLVDAVCHLQLAAKRAGATIALRDACDGVREVLELVGLTELLEQPDRAGSVLDVVGETEGGEQCGVEEVVDPDDLLP